MWEDFLVAVKSKVQLNYDMPANISTKHIRISFQSREAAGNKVDTSFRPVASIADLVSIYAADRMKSPSNSKER